MADEPANLAQELFAALADVAEILERHAVRYALIGGLATSYRSQPRFTKDLDFLLEVPQMVLPPLLQDLAEHGGSLDLVATIQEWTQHHLASFTYRGLRVDWLKPVLPAYRHVLDRSTIEPWANCRLRMATAEGLILLKLLAFRAQDLADIENLVAACRGHLDVGWIEVEWGNVADRQDPRWQRFLEILGKSQL
jgi:hypothetical protein